MSFTDIKAKLGSIKAAVSSMEEIVDRAVSSAEDGGFKRIDDAGGQAIYNELRIRCFMSHQMADFATNVVLSLIRKGEVPGLSIVDPSGGKVDCVKRVAELEAQLVEKQKTLEIVLAVDKEHESQRDAAQARVAELEVQILRERVDGGKPAFERAIAERDRLAAEIATLKSVMRDAADRARDGRAVADMLEEAAGLEAEP